MKPGRQIVDEIDEIAIAAPMPKPVNGGERLAALSAMPSLSISPACARASTTMKSPATSGITLQARPATSGSGFAFADQHRGGGRGAGEPVGSPSVNPPPTRR